MSMIQLESVSREYREGANRRVVLQDIDLIIDKGEMIAIKGKSGCGKTTLVNIIAGIDLGCTGRYVFNDQQIHLRNQNDAAKFRRKHIGIVVQHFALLDDLTAYDNIAMALWADHVSSLDQRKRVDSLMDELDILSLKKQYPKTLSGGEKQRVAIARALLRNPDLILADEPTGALDEATGQQIMSIFSRLQSNGRTLLLVTHDDTVADKCTRIINLKDGKIH